MSTFGFMDIIIIVSGAYLVYVAIQMKRTGEITSSAIIGKGCDVKKAKDPQGFIDYMYMKSIIMGVLVIISGAVDYMNDVYWNIPYFGLAVCGIFLVILLVYCKISMNAQKKYLSPK